MSQDLAQYEQKLQELRNNYLLELPSKLSSLLSQLDAVLEGLAKGALLNTLIADLKRGLHTIAGSSGVFGFTDLSQKIRVFEGQLLQYVNQELDVHVLHEIRLGLETLLANVKLQADEATKTVQLSSSDAFTLEENTDDQLHLKCVLLYGFEGKEEKKIFDQLLYFGYQPVIVTNADNADADLSYTSWSILVVNRSGCNHETVKVLIDHLALKYNRKLPLIFCHGSGQFADRYLAASVECENYLTGDLDIITLVESIEEMYTSSCGLPERILAIDDDKDLIDYLKLFFQKEGFEFCACEHPERLLDTMSDFNPELILMDLNMPNYEGAYLASVVRQFEQWSSIPVLYLSNEIDMKKIHFAMSKGADDFILKPFDDRELVFIIKYKIQRYRFLKKHISKDGLTGLLKHSVIKNALDAELERAERLNHTVSAIMVDLDNFKQINDQYGHAMGDQVLSSLSKLFKNRFRKCDLIGRYGGEEFLIILPICTPLNAKKILDDILKDFARLDFTVGNTAFNVTFSAGISSSTEGDGTASTILKQADSLLYKAKREGKNRVLIE